MMLCRIDIFIVSHFLQCVPKSEISIGIVGDSFGGIRKAVKFLEILYICKHTDE